MTCLLFVLALISTSGGAPPAKTVRAEVAPTAEVPGTITGATWKTHPAIIEIRELVSNIADPNKRPLWFEMWHSFDDHCVEHAVLKVGLGYVREGGPLSRFQLVEGWGDIRRDTLIYYDEAGHARFLSSTYTHSGVGSSYLSRAYYSAGELLFGPEVEQQSGRSGPADDKSADQFVILKARDAELRFFAVAGLCAQK